MISHFLNESRCAPKKKKKITQLKEAVVAKNTCIIVQSIESCKENIHNVAKSNEQFPSQLNLFSNLIKLDIPELLCYLGLLAYPLVHIWAYVIKHRINQKYWTTCSKPLKPIILKVEFHVTIKNTFDFYG